MRVAVTGANGFVGRHVIARLLLGGHDVRALVSERPGAESELPESGGGKMDVRRADMRRPDSLRGAFDGIDCISRSWLTGFGTALDVGPSGISANSLVN